MLITVKESENRYKMEHWIHTTDVTKLANGKNGTKKYRFGIHYADASRLTAQAEDGLNNDSIFAGDVRTIDRSGGLVKINWC